MPRAGRARSGPRDDGTRGGIVSAALLRSLRLYVAAASASLAGVAVHLRSVVIDDAAHDQRFKRLGAAEVGSLLCVPLMDGNVLLGTLTATSPHVQAFDTRRRDLLQVFADQAVLAITKARQAESAQKQAAELAMLLDVSRALTSSLEPKE